MSHNEQPKLRIEGTVAPGFESIRTLYEDNMRTLAERNTQLCVYHQGKKVVDLWGSTVGDDAFSPDTLANVFSSGKSLEAIAMATLVDQGLLTYDASISSYWPEFSANDKEGLTVADLMRHEAGLAAFDTSLLPEDLLTANLKQNKIGEVIERQTQKYREKGSRREYHAITRGWVANELFRRVDPAGRTIGEFLRDNIRGPLGVDTIIGVKEDELSRRSPVVPVGMRFQFLQSLLPKFLGRKVELNFFQLLGRILRLLPGIMNGTTRNAPPPFQGMKEIAYFNEPAVAMGETPSANAHSSARGLAKIAAMMAEGGSWEGVTYLGSEAWQAMHGEPVEQSMGFAGTIFTQGGVNLFKETNKKSPSLERAFNEGREGFYGWMGLGGSLFQWHPVHNIGFGYVPTSLNVIDLFNERGKSYQAEVLKCVAQLQGN